MTRRLLIATGSTHKLDELRALLELPNAQLVSLADAGLDDDAPEDGTTFEQNALFKARWYAQRSGLPTLADDSGLEVDALGGAPGVRTRRFASENATDAENNAYLMALLEGLAPDRRSARYRCALAFVEPGASEPVMTAGTFEGRIALEPRGTGGFGYDPLFEPATEPIGGLTVGQLPTDVKNAISHRAQAARAMRNVLIARGY